MDAALGLRKYLRVCNAETMYVVVIWCYYDGGMPNEPLHSANRASVPILKG